MCWKNPTNPIVHPIMSSVVNTKLSFNFIYGKLAIRAKMPSGDWIEPSEQKKGKKGKKYFLNAIESSAQYF